MGELSKNNYSIAKNCINTQFCYDGGSIDSSQVSLPKTLKVKIIANPDYWGFGSLESNVLVSGYATFGNGYYDFFDGFQPDHLGTKVCGRTLVGEFKNEQRPDVGYRSVYDDETGRLHYNGTTSNDVMRGGGEVYLIDRTATKTTDQNSCDETDPQDVFKKTPDNYGYGNKILLSDDVFKNITGGWRLNSCTNCYATGIINDLRFTCCSGSGGLNSPKQHILFDENFGQYYDPARKRCLSPRYSGEIECNPDGTTPDEFSGQLISVSRDTGISPFLTAQLSYFGSAASGLRNGQQLLIIDSGSQFYNAYYIFDVSHSGNTYVKLNGTFGTENISYTAGSGDKWIALGTLDPESCCGGAALGVDNTTKFPNKQPVYHVDIPKIFNNAKNNIYSNRGKYQAGSPRVARNYVATSGSGEFAIPSIIDGAPENPRLLPYFGPYYEVDNQDKALRFFNDSNTITHKNYTCYTKSQSLQIFPDCLTQSYEYLSCEQTSKHYQINVPRLAFVYRPCNYNDVCTFSGGLPLTAGGSGMPSSLDDLRRGFGGQEVVMYINLGDAWGKEIKRTPCSCIGVPPGTQPPEVVVIKSPITYPCFMKYDLNPSGYGCQDPAWYVYAKNYLGITETGNCGIAAYYDACWKKQPYTTYGFIRNLCGHETHNRKEVIQSLANIHNGAFTDVAGNSGIISSEPMYINFVVPADQVGSGYPVGNCTSVSEEIRKSGGFTYDDGVCLSGNKPYWGLTDNDGRLAYPYFPTKISSGVIPCTTPPVYQKYVDFDNQFAFSGGFPKEGVPFLIEIDHEDYCVGCSTSQLEVKDHHITIESLSTQFYHGNGQVTGFESYDDLIYKYGFNHCKYPGAAVTPTYDANSDTWRVSVCDGSSFINQSSALQALSAPYTGETCDCIGNGITTTLFTHPLIGTNIPKYWSSSGVNNSYVKFDGCEFGFTSDYLSCPGSINGTNVATVLSSYDIYFAARMSCGSINYWEGDAGFTEDASYANGLSTWLACGGCSHSYPATDSKPNIGIDFYYVSTKWRELFERMSDIQLLKNEDFLNNGASKGEFYGGNRPTAFTGPLSTVDCDLGGGVSGISFANGRGGTTCWPTVNNEGLNYGAGSPFCGSPIINEKAFTYNGSPGADCAYFLENDLNYVQWTNNIPGCAGAKIKIYGVSLKNGQGKHSRWLKGSYGIVAATEIGSSCSTCINGTRPLATSTYGPLVMFAANSGGLADAYWLGASRIVNFGCTTDCNEFISQVSCLGSVCAGMEQAIGCQFDETGGCCVPNNRQEDTGQIIRRPNEKFIDQCWADALPLTLLGEFTYYEFTPSEVSQYGAGCVDGWYGYLNIHHSFCMTDESWTVASQDNANTPDTEAMIAWEGFNLPNIGDTNIMPFGEPIAFRYNDVQSCFDTSASISYKSICEFDQSVNKTIQVDSEFIIPSRTTTYGKDLHLAPVNCNVMAGGTGLNMKTEVGSTCVKPIPFNTFNNSSLVAGYGEIETGGSFKVNVIKPACFPEIMTVHKVECNDGVYALHVSREYYEHDRILYYMDAYVDPDTLLLITKKEPLFGRLDGGQTITKYTCGTGRNSRKVASICDSGASCVVDDTMPYYGLLPKMSETDLVTPCNPETCVTGVLPFAKSICANYAVAGGTVGGSNGAGGSGYFEVLPAFVGSPTGCLTFKITNPGSGYYSSLYNSGNATVVVTGCAIGLYDRPECLRLNLKIYPNLNYDKVFDVATQSLVANTGGYNGQYFVYSGTLNISACSGSFGLCGFETGIYPVTFGPCDGDITSLPCESSTETCLDATQYYPNLWNGASGTQLWNFYNLFYDSGSLGGLCLDDADPDSNVWFKDERPGDDPEPFPFNIQYNALPNTGRTLYHSKANQVAVSGIIPFSETGIRCLHSCIQDHTTCGGSFFCNKEFFPRRSYLAGTKVAKFAPFSICAQNGEKGFGTWLDGHISDDFITTYNESPLPDNEQQGWLDPCNPDSVTNLVYDIGIDDHIIYVSDLTPLIGSKHPYYKMLNPSGLDTKSCIYPTSGCFDFLGTHNERTINGIEARTFETGDDTYSEIKQSGCLFEPFKIFMDVQCCGERLGHPGTEDPMYLSWIANGVPAGACKGIVFDQSCTCYGDSNSCQNNAQYFGTTPYTLELVNYWVGTTNSAFGCEAGCVNENKMVFQQPDFTDPCCSYSNGVAVATNYGGNYYIFTTNDVLAPHGVLARYIGDNDNYLHCTTNNPKRVVPWDFCYLTSNARLIGSLSSSITLNGSNAVAAGSGIANFGASGCYGGCNSYCAQLMLDFGCDCVSKARECDYTSIVKLTVTE